MKALTVTAMLISLSAFGQFAIQSHFNETYIGRNQSLGVKRIHNKFSYYLDATYFINRIDHIRQNGAIKKCAYARNFGERIGLQLGFEYYLFQNSYGKVGAFINTQINSMGAKYQGYLAYAAFPDSAEYDYVYVKKDFTYGPIFTMDNVIGITLNPYITDNLFLNIKAGFGMIYWKNADNNGFTLFVEGKTNRGTLFTSFFNFGLGYSLGKPNSK